MKIAVAGKGGVGKSTISAALVNYFAAGGYKIYAVDGDADLSLGEILGLPSEKVNELRPIVEMREAVREATGGEGSLFSINPDVDTLLDNYSVGSENIRFFKMGSVKKGGSACYCRENSVLNALVTALLLNKDEMVLLDMGAGIEHLTRGTAGGVDVMLIVTEPTQVSINTALTIKDLAEEIGVLNTGIVVNKIMEDEDKVFYKSLLRNHKVIGEFEYSSALRRNGSDAQFESQVENLASKILNISNFEAAEVEG